MKQKEMEAIPINYDLLNLITPQGILLKNNKVELGDITHKLQYISAYPSAVNVRMANEPKRNAKYNS